MLTPENFGKHIVKAYEKTYTFCNDYTLSCLDLNHFSTLKEATINLFSLLQQAIHSNNHLIKNMLHKSRAKHHCTFFDEPDYIDLKHFLMNLLENIKTVALQKNTSVAFSLKDVAQSINNVIKSIDTTVAHNVAGSQHKHASGLSIYFPEHVIHRSYKANQFANATPWLLLLQNYLA